MSPPNDLDSPTAALEWPPQTPPLARDGRLLGLGEDRECLYRPVLPGDEAQLIALRAECFERADGLGEDHAPSSNGYAPPSLPEIERLWKWKFLSCPSGNHSQLAIEKKSGKVIGHVGGLPFPTWCRGRTRITTQSTENMLSPRLRLGLARVGVFAKLVNSWVDSWFGPERDFIAWGFPSNANFRIGQRFCKYYLIRPVSVLWHSAPAKLAAREASVLTRRVPRVGEEADLLWQRTRVELELALERTRRHLNWRYAEHPEQRYTFLEARAAESGALRGLAVLRAGGLDPTAALLCDWIVPLADAEARQALLAAAGCWAEEHGLGGIIAWFPEGQAHFAAFQEAGFRVRYTPMISVGRSWDSALSIEAIRRGFYMSAGDVDYL